MKENKYNRLIKEKSPYLKSHADNPVDWYPWCQEAFDKAKRENKLIFLSIGYSSCHWCHVMEEECFMDKEVAEILNKNFVSIKVDKEERPDIDEFYMSVCYFLTGSGGWPLTIVMTPDKKPFFAATYLPKNSKYGLKGLVEILNEILYLWKTKKEEIEKFSHDVLKNLEKGEKLYSKIKFKTREDINRDIFKNAYNRLKSIFDFEKGGFGSAPKFPNVQNLLLLLKYHKFFNDDTALLMVEKTLENMRMGGIYDHIGGGFHRYSTDREWKIPHFEKMLYDQAFISLLYLETFRATKKEFYLKTAEETIEFVLREMNDPKGYFYSSYDADSEGEEGKFYLWSYEELKNLLTEKEFKILNEIFEINPEGNFEGKIVLYSDKGYTELIKYEKEWKTIKSKLFKEREKRKKPFLDKKMLTDWNSLFIHTLLKAYAITEKEFYLKRAVKAIDFIMKNLKEKDILYHMYMDGEKKIEGFIDDYAFFINTLLYAYQITFDIFYLKEAIKLTNYVIENFMDRNSFLFYTQSDIYSDLPFRKKDLFEGAYPTGNSYMIYNLIRLYKITSEKRYEELFLKGLSSLESLLKKGPEAFSFVLNAIDFYLHDSYEIVVVGDRTYAKELILNLEKLYIPNFVCIYKNPEDRTIKNTISFISDYNMIEGKTTFYICRNFMCLKPITDLNYVLKFFKQN